MAKFEEQQFTAYNPNSNGEHYVIDESIESLRQILSSEQNREVSYAEAQEIGQSLISFYAALSGDS